MNTNDTTYLSETFASAAAELAHTTEELDAVEHASDQLEDELVRLQTAILEAEIRLTGTLAENEALTHDYRRLTEAQASAEAERNIIGRRLEDVRAALDHMAAASTATEQSPESRTYALAKRGDTAALTKIITRWLTELDDIALAERYRGVTEPNLVPGTVDDYEKFLQRQSHLRLNGYLEDDADYEEFRKSIMARIEALLQATKDHEKRRQLVEKFPQGVSAADVVRLEALVSSVEKEQKRLDEAISEEFAKIAASSPGVAQVLRSLRTEITALSGREQQMLSERERLSANRETLSSRIDHLTRYKQNLEARLIQAATAF